jgi:ABC-type Fe3+-hydroxamate transport system substrate-binding protein
MRVSGDKSQTRSRNRWWWYVVVTLVLPCAAACRTGRHGAPTQSNRYVSLSPAITETLFDLGAGSSVVGVSDYCHYPKEVESLPHVGSGYTPRYEAIAGLAPTTIFLESVNAETSRALASVLDVKLMPWLTLEQVMASTRQLGQLTDKVQAAERLVRAYELRMKTRVSAASPRVLLVLAHTPGQLRDAWFIKKNSIHGRVLEAAGARNAVPDENIGAPHLSLEQVIRLDPDGIVILQSAARIDDRLVDDWRRLSVLSAARTGRIQEIAAPEVTIPGPRIIELVQRLSPWVSAWSKVP